MIFNEILHELRRIANALEKQANISDFPVEMREKKPSIPTMSASNIEEAQAREEENVLKEARKELETLEKEGFFFAEDGMSEELLERL